jgi:hypothetical protein
MRMLEYWSACGRQRQDGISSCAGAGRHISHTRCAAWQKPRPTGHQHHQNFREELRRTITTSEPAGVCAKMRRYSIDRRSAAAAQVRRTSWWRHYGPTEAPLYIDQSLVHQVRRVKEHCAFGAVSEEA